MKSKELSKKIGYSFQNENLLKRALTHRSYDDLHNERFEFLGDSIVNCVIADILHEKFPFASEGDLSRFRASLINRTALGTLARGFDLGHFLFLGLGELKSGGSERLSILSCAMEALIGAIYLDGGFNVVHECIHRWYQPLLHSLTFANSHKDPKTKLQEYLQSKQLPLPIYTVSSIKGESHQQIFTVKCVVPESTLESYGKGTSRRRAEQEAAAVLLGMIE